MARTIAEKLVRPVVTIEENRSALEAAILMAEQFIGSVVVTSAATVTRIPTERDLIMRVVGKGLTPDRVTIKDVMTTDLIRVGPADSSSHCLNLMKENRCRHLLVFNGGEFLGIVSLRDMVTLLVDEKEELIEHLQRYISS